MYTHIIRDEDGYNGVFVSEKELSNFEIDQFMDIYIQKRIEFERRVTKRARDRQDEINTLVDALKGIDTNDDILDDDMDAWIDSVLSTNSYSIDKDHKICRLLRMDDRIVGYSDKYKCLYSEQIIN